MITNKSNLFTGSLFLVLLIGCEADSTSPNQNTGQALVKTFQVFNKGKSDWEVLTRAYTGATNSAGRFSNIGFVPPSDSNWTFFEDSLVELTLFIQSKIVIGKCEKGKIWTEKYHQLDDEFEIRPPSDVNCNALEPFVLNQN